MARLPSAYQEVEWIQSDGECWLNTNFMPNGQTSVYGKIMFLPEGITTNRWTWGCGTDWNRNVFEFSIDVTSYHGFAWDYGANTGGGRLGSTPQAEHIYSVEQVKNTLKIIDETAGTTSHNTSYFSEQTFNTNINMTIFSSSRGSDSPMSPKSIMRLWYLKIYDNGTLVRDMIPCYRKSDNEIGMYDIVNDVFYTNQGTGTFSKGSSIYTFPDFRAVKNFYIPQVRLPEEYQEVEYIQGETTTQYIDTGVSLRDYDQNLDITIDFQETFIGNTAVGLVSSGSYSGLYWFTFPEVASQVFYIQMAAGTWATISPKPSGRCLIKLNSKTGAVSVDDFSCTTTTQSFIDYANEHNITNNGNLYLFGANNIVNDGIYIGASRVYYALFKNATTGEKIKEFIPCYRTSDNKIGMFDLVTKSFYPSNGSSDFTIKGNDVDTGEEVIKISTPSGEVLWESWLPSQYQEVEYIRGVSSEGPYIDTDFTTTLTMKMEADAKCNGLGDCVLGTMPISASTNSNFSLGRYNGTTAYMCWNGREIGSGDWSTRKTMIAYQDDDTIYRQLGEDVSSISVSLQTLSTPSKLWLFRRNDGGTPSTSSGDVTLYGCKLYDNNILQRHFIPCYRKSDNEIGLYDRVTKTFFTNQGTGAFTKGPDVT